MQKFTIKDTKHIEANLYLHLLAEQLEVSPQTLFSKINRHGLPVGNYGSKKFRVIGHKTMRDLLNPQFEGPKVISIQIIKGGTGKTTVCANYGLCLNLYGAKVLYIDTDQNANLTKYLLNEDDIDPDLAILSNVLFDGYDAKDAVINLKEGLDLVPSNIRNSLLDELIRSRNLPIDRLIRKKFAALFQEYDVVLIDCPHSMGPLVGAIALASDLVLCPLDESKDSLGGYNILRHMFDNLEDDWDCYIESKIIFNEYSKEKRLAKYIMGLLNTTYKDDYLGCTIRDRQRVRDARAGDFSIFEKIKFSNRTIMTTDEREDIESLMFKIYPNLLPGLKKSYARRTLINNEMSL